MFKINLKSGYNLVWMKEENKVNSGLKYIFAIMNN
jgi:hypothetical protein